MIVWPRTGMSLKEKLDWLSERLEQAQQQADSHRRILERIAKEDRLLSGQLAREELKRPWKRSD
jgi:DNA-binding GntR family transcriptional regulator